MERKLKDYVLLVLKGVSMGAADVVPGVSGGTIAFIEGIYDELIDSIKSINLQNLKLLFKGKIGEFSKNTNLAFLMSVLLGICISVFSLAKVITWLLTEYPIFVWSFFFGLVLASTWFVSKDIKSWNWKIIIGFIMGVAVAFYVTIATPSETPSNLFFIFFCGAIAICAMILPGISGSFILVLLGKYFYVMEAVKSLDFIIIIVFAAGACVGIVSFSRILSYALKHFRNMTLAVLTGFMLGSLNKVWPWKEIIPAKGNDMISFEKNILPDDYVLEAIALMLLGFLMVYLLERISSKSTKG